MPNIPAYTITSLIHEGAETVLYRGLRDADRTPIALKLPRGDHPSPQLLARLRHEHTIARDLRLDGVVATSALVKIGNSLALVMEDFGGRPLHAVAREGHLDLESSLRIAISLARTLAAIHARGVLHRDIKPHNILYCARTGSVKFTDFGIATRTLDEKPVAEGRQPLAGTLAYMAPEQTGRMNLAVDRRSDLYSLGVTLYELLSGAPPFQAVDPMDLVHSHIARVPAPLHQRAPSVPPPLSAIVMKLLAKSPDDRYQSGAGLMADLEECLSQWKASGRIQAFPLGRQDAGELRIPDKLYGRGAELQILEDAFTRVAGGATEAIFVVGGAGVGKSTLMSEAQRIIAEKGGYLGSTRFEKLEQGAPYGAMARALRELVQKMLSRPAETLDRFRDKLRAAAGPNGQILVEIIPELALILGPQPAPPDLGPTAARNRLGLLVQRFIQAFERPVALFLDDLQSADASSRSLLRLLLTDPERPHLLVVGAYRDPEVPLADLRADLHAHGVAVGEIALSPLDPEAVRELLMDMLGSDASTAASLADLIHNKTHGNPFFLQKLLRTVQVKGLFTLDPREKRWSWDSSRIEEMAVNDDIADVVAAKLLGVASRTRQTLEVAACIGPAFELEMLSTIHGVSQEDAASSLGEALEEGLVTLISSDQRAEHAPGGEAGSPCAVYRFVHDRVRQAAYARVEPDRRRALHLGIGRLFRARLPATPSDAQLFEMVSHKNLGAALIDDAAERMELARLNLAAGRKAKAQAAHASAAGYLQAGITLLPPSAWDDAYDPAFPLHLEQAECDVLVGRVEDAEARFLVLAARARSRSDRARAAEQRVALYTLLSRFGDAVRVAREELAELGIDLPQGTERIAAALGEACAEAQAALGGRRVQDLADAPSLADPDARAAIRLLIAVNAAAYLEDALLSGLTNVVRTVLCQRHGRSEMDPFIYGTYAFFLVVSGRYDEARMFWGLADALNERGGPVDLQGKTSNVLVAFAHFFRPLRETLAQTYTAHERCLQGGDLVYAAYAANTAVVLLFAAGNPLESIHAEAARHLTFMQRSKEVMSIHVQTVARQLAAGLLGRTRDPRTFDDDACDEAELAADIAASGVPYVGCWFHTAKLMLAVFAEDYQGAARSAAEAERLSGGALGNQFVYELPLYAGIARAALHKDAAPAERERIMVELGERRAALLQWAARCPANYAARSLLLSAELARISGDGAAARELYDQAIAAAREREMLHLDALANDLCAKFYLERGQDKLAAVYLKDAHHAYLLWGAERKAALLVARHPEIMAAGAARERSAADAATSTTGSTGAGLDIVALIRAAQTIAGEIVLDALIERLLRAAVESAGARRGVLLLAREGDLRVVAKLALDPDRLETGLSVPAGECGDIATSVVQLVARTRSAIVVGDASRDIRFAGDAHLSATRARSVLCLAMQHKGELAGVLYLENNVVAEAFTPARVDLCALLSSQAAIAVENALLVEELRRRTEELREANEGLTRELAERAALEQELMRVQTPIIPITDRVMVMPLVGTIDVARAQQILETALEGVQSRRAKAVILDITGVTQISSDIAASLMRTARALGLLGAEAIITGIRPAVAKALIDLRVDLGSLVTRGTLQAGIAYAVGRSGGGP